ncbi:hypothetical protein LIER_25679 [Lithospermum erythrorhizon]|uniref:Uncharacterized protein n=1 Tax=Lithospermum erythrorhizon TaxID=34254 RepID=A0AAV3R8P8_LITER
MPIGSDERYKSDHPFFVDTPYVLPSGVRVTDDSVSRPIHSLPADMLKNCMLREEVLGAMKVQSLTRLHQQFTHYQLRATVAAYAMSLQWAESAREKLVSIHAESEGKLNSEIDALKESSQKTTQDFEKTKAELLEIRSLLEDCLAEKESMNSRLFAAETSATSPLKTSRRAVRDEYVVDLFDDIPEDDDEDVSVDNEDGDASEGVKTYEQMPHFL